MTKRSRPWFLALAVTLVVASAGAFSFLGSRWTTPQVVMRLQLGSSGGGLIDGSASWDAVAERSIAIWNGYLAGVQLAAVRDPNGVPGDGDRLNQVFFDRTIYGRPFGDAVAVTTEWTRNNNRERIEADVIMNSALPWNSYRGPFREARGGGNLYDLQRVLLHELGHVLGLDHPDESGQNVVAIMNSRVSDIDRPQADDVQGAQALYGARAGRPQVRFTRPGRTATTTTANRFLFRGTADPGQATAIYLVNASLSPRRFLRAAGVNTWSRAVPLRPGANRIVLYARTLSGERVRLAVRVVNRSRG